VSGNDGQLGGLLATGGTVEPGDRKHIEKDAALERRFQPVLVDEPSVEDTISILRGLNDGYEVHQRANHHDATASWCIDRR
jgi:ATP-dependent Clp protease ATP-binding subunit ClpB